MPQPKPRRVMKATKAAATPLQGPLFEAVCRKFLGLRRVKSHAEKAMEKPDVKGAIKKALETYGVPDETKSQFLWFSEPIEGYKGMKHERRVSKTLDEAKAVALLAKKKILDKYATASIQVKDPEEVLAILRKHAPQLVAQITETVYEVDESQLFAAVFKEDLTQVDVDAIITEDVTWAVVPVT